MPPIERPRGRSARARDCRRGAREGYEYGLVGLGVGSGSGSGVGASGWASILVRREVAHDRQGREDLWSARAREGRDKLISAHSGAGRGECGSPTERCVKGS